MTIASETNRSGPYLGNGATTVFAGGFPIVDEEHVEVILADADGVEAVQVLDTDYTVSGVGDDTFDVTMLVAPASGKTLTLIRSVPFTQEVDLQNQGAYYAETIEAALDLGVARDQQLQEQIDRAVKISPSSDADPAELIADLEEASGDAVAAAAAALASQSSASASASSASGSASAASASAISSAASAADAAASAAAAAGALLGDIASAIHSATGKTTPVDADEFGLVDSAASNALKKLTWANLKTTFFAALGALLAAGTSKATPVDADTLLLSDSAASNATKKLTWANLKTTLALVFARLDTAGQVLTGGVRVTPYDFGTVSSGTLTLDPGNRQLQYGINGGAFTWAPGSNKGTWVAEVTNNGSAGAVTSSFTKTVGSFTTTNGHKFVVTGVVHQTYSLLTIQALQ